MSHLRAVPAAPTRRPVTYLMRLAPLADVVDLDAHRSRIIGGPRPTKPNSAVS